MRHTPADRVSAPLEVSVRGIADAPVALVVHARDVLGTLVPGRRSAGLT